MAPGLGNVRSGLETFRIAELLSLVFLVNGFNLDTTNPTVFSGRNDSHFGERVLQFGDDRMNWIGVMGRDEMGAATLFQCSPGEEDCSPTGLTDFFNDSAVLSIDTTATQVVVCDPTTVQRCMRNSWLPGNCRRFSPQLQPRGRLDTGTKECIPEMVDVVFLFDGSNSLSKRDLDNNKAFMLRMMEQADAGMQFAVVQYSLHVRTEINFTQFQMHRKNLNKMVAKIELMESATFTATGIDHTIKEVFTEAAGAREGAAKLLIVITDGATTPGDKNLTTVVSEAKKKGITRCAIGVGKDFQTGSKALDELKVIASSPSYLIQVTDYSELQSVFQDLKSKIYRIEGTQSASNETSFEMEMSQLGFTALLTEDSVVLGAVGAYDWSGGLLEIRDDTSTFINASKGDQDMKNSYLGYSVKEAVYGNTSLYVVGAPRYRHTGKVIVFGLKDTRWEPKQHISGDQIGSYFGSELCVVDLRGDGEMVLLLIGAPLYYQPGYGGMVTVCSLLPQGNFSCTSLLRGEPGDGLGRFGSSIAGLRDLNGDGLADVAVGAPLEDEHRGRVYIYQGVSGGLESRYSQRITGRQFSPALMYFGQSVQGSMDVTGDGLTDIVVGASGNAVLLRSRPVVDISAELHFQPEQIGLHSYRCPWSGPDGSRLVDNVSLCFNLSVVGPGPAGQLTMNLSYQLGVDGSRQYPRAVLEDGGRTSSRHLDLTAGTQCVQHRVWLPACVKDSLTPISLSLNFSVRPVPDGVGGTLPPVLSHRCPTALTRMLRLESNCGEDEMCTDRLRIGLQLAGSGPLVLGRTAGVELRVRLSNEGEDSYNTSVRIHHPPGLDLRRLNIGEDVECKPSHEASASQPGTFTCSVSHPIFRQDQQVAFGLSFEISGHPDWGDQATIRAEAVSTNPDSITDEATSSVTIPVLYAIEVVVTSLQTTRYVRFTGDDQLNQNVIHTYKVENLGPYALPLSLSLTFTSEISLMVRWDAEVRNEAIQGQEVRCGNVTKGPAEELAQETPITETVLAKHVNCQFWSRPNSLITFHLTGSAWLLTKPEAEAQLTFLSSWARLSLNTSRYVSHNWELSHRAQGQTEVQMEREIRRSLMVIGSVCGLIPLLIIILVLWRCGFFKRQAPEDFGNGTEGAEGAQMISAETPADPGTPSDGTEPANGESCPSA